MSAGIVLDTELDTYGGFEDVQSDAVISRASSYSSLLGTQYIDYFKFIISRLPPNCHYIVYRDSQYSYVCYAGVDLSLSGSIVSGSGCTVYHLIVPQSYNNDDYKQFIDIADVSIDTSSGVYYSDLKGYPDIRGGDYYVGISFVYALCVFFIFILLIFLYKLPRHFRRR